MSCLRSGSVLIERRWNSSSALTSDSVEEIVDFLGEDSSKTPVLLNSKEHVVGYLSKILNARVYDVAVETDLQHAKNLSAVCFLASLIASLHSKGGGR